MSDPTIAAQFEEMRQTANELQTECDRLRAVVSLARILHRIETMPVTMGTLVAHSEDRTKAVELLGKALERLDK
jgi:uncharacterized coiled-coil DUF342 family protein